MGRPGPFAIAALSALAMLTTFLAACGGAGPAATWQAEAWMAADPALPPELPARVLSLTDLPSLKGPVSADDFVAAIDKSRAAGSHGAVLTFSWPALEKRAGEYTLDDLKGAVVANRGRVLYLGIQVLNTTRKELPQDLHGKAFDDPDVLRRFRALLDTLAPLLRNRIPYLSIGNESDVYLSLHPQEMESFRVFLQAARMHVKRVAANTAVGTTLTSAGAVEPAFTDLVRQADAHFLTYYHGKPGGDGEFEDTAATARRLIELAARLDQRPIVFQEVGFPAQPPVGSPQQQAQFVNGVFDAWQALGGRVPFLNYFMLYDFPDDFVAAQAGYYGLEQADDSFAAFLGSLGLHDENGVTRPAWAAFVKRAREIE